MSGLNAANAIQKTNPPLEFSKKAIREHLQFHATNGPAYVQIQATKALARMIGLYEDARLIARQAFEAAKSAAQEVIPTQKKLGPIEQAIADGVDFADFSCYSKSDDSEEDEEAARKEDDDVP